MAICQFSDPMLLAFAVLSLSVLFGTVLGVSFARPNSRAVIFGALFGLVVFAIVMIALPFVAAAFDGSCGVTLVT